MNKRSWTILFLLLALALLVYFIAPTSPNFTYVIDGTEHHIRDWHDVSWGGILVSIIVIGAIGLLLIPVLLTLSVMMVGLFGLLLCGIFLVFAPLFLPGIILILLIYVIVKKSK